MLENRKYKNTYYAGSVCSRADTSFQLPEEPLHLLQYTFHKHQNTDMGRDERNKLCHPICVCFFLNVRQHFYIILHETTEYAFSSHREHFGGRLWPVDHLDSIPGGMFPPPCVFFAHFFPPLRFPE